MHFKAKIGLCNKLLFNKSYSRIKLARTFMGAFCGRLFGLVYTHVCLMIYHNTYLPSLLICRILTRMLPCTWFCRWSYFPPELVLLIRCVPRNSSSILRKACKTISFSCGYPISSIIETLTRLNSESFNLFQIAFMACASSLSRRSFQIIILKTHGSTDWSIQIHCLSQLWHSPYLINPDAVKNVFKSRDAVIIFPCSSL